MPQRRILFTVLGAVAYVLIGCDAPSNIQPQDSSPKALAAPTKFTRQLNSVRLVPGQLYATKAKVNLYPNTSKLDVVKKNAMQIPRGQLFKCIMEQSAEGGTWYMIFLTDQAGQPHTGYIDVDEFAAWVIQPYTPTLRAESRPVIGSSQQPINIIRRPPYGCASSQNSHVGVSGQSAVVYIAPYSGKKYHGNPSCRGLGNSRTVASKERNVAIAEGYEPCKICLGGSR